MPVYHCVYVTCKNTSYNYGGTFFSLPGDVDLHAVWLENSGRTDLKKFQCKNISAKYRICMKHFARKDFSDYPKMTRLKHGVVPLHFNYATSITSDDTYLPPLKLEQCPLAVPLGAASYSYTDRAGARAISCDTSHHHQAGQKNSCVMTVAEESLPGRMEVCPPIHSVLGGNFRPSGECDDLAPLRLECCPLTVPLGEESLDLTVGSSVSSVQRLIGTCHESRTLLPKDDDLLPLKIEKCPLAVPLLPEDAEIVQNITVSRQTQTRAMEQLPKPVKPPYKWKLRKDILGRELSSYRGRKLKVRQTLKERVARVVQAELQRNSSLRLRGFSMDVPVRECTRYDILKKTLEDSGFKDLLEDKSREVRNVESVQSFRSLSARNLDLNLLLQRLASISHYYSSDLDQILREVGRCLPPHLVMFFTSQLINAESNQMVWPSEVRKILVGLYSISPAAYRLLSSKLYFPAEIKVKEWMSQCGSELLSGVCCMPEFTDICMNKCTKSTNIADAAVSELAYENFMSTLI